MRISPLLAPVTLALSLVATSPALSAPEDPAEAARAEAARMKVERKLTDLLTDRIDRQVEASLSADVRTALFAAEQRTPFGRAIANHPRPNATQCRPSSDGLVCVARPPANRSPAAFRGR